MIDTVGHLVRMDTAKLSPECAQFSAAEVGERRIDLRQPPCGPIQARNVVTCSGLLVSAPYPEPLSEFIKLAHNSPIYFAYCSIATGISADTMEVMAMTLRLTEAESRALRLRAEHEGRPMQEVARQAIREYVEAHSRTELLDRVLDTELPRYAEALERLGQ